MTLLIMAAGMGSRFGGLKQLEGFGPHNQLLLEYSVYDAIQAGFNRAVFIIKEEHQQDFITHVTSKIENHINVQLVFQTNQLPNGYNAHNRTKPFGTGHAILSAMDVIGDDNFAVINADDFYSKSAFVTIANHLKNHDSHCLAGYQLANTISQHGTVSRGVCQTDSNGLLTSILEHEKIDSAFKNNTPPITTLSPDTIVSMNAWGFKSRVFPFFHKEYLSFLEENKSDLSSCEFYLTYPIMKLIEAEPVNVYLTDAKWYGVTYKEDKPYLTDALASMVQQGIYPENLW